MTLVIKDWHQLFENGESRKYIRLKWIPLPNKQTGLGFRRIAGHKNASDIFSAWILMLQMASQRPRGKRGELKNSDDSDMDAEDMGYATGFPKKIFEIAIPILLDPKIAWIEETIPPELIQSEPTLGTDKLPMKAISQTEKAKEDTTKVLTGAKLKAKAKQNIPTLQEVKEYCLERKNGIDPETFWHHYEARGWIMSNGKEVRSWRSCVITWEKKGFNKGVAPPVPKKEYLN